MICHLYLPCPLMRCFVSFSVTGIFQARSAGNAMLGLEKYLAGRELRHDAARVHARGIRWNLQLAAVAGV